MLRRALPALCLVLAIIPCLQQASGQEARPPARPQPIEILALVQFVSKYCPTLQIDDSAVNSALESQGFSIAKLGVDAVLDQYGRSVGIAAQFHGDEPGKDETLCQRYIALYGPNGRVIPNLVRSKS